MPQGQRPHMRTDDIGFARVKRIPRLGVLQRRRRMGKAVYLALRRTVVPVVQVKIMQERAAHKALFVCAEVQAAVQPKAGARHRHAVVVSRHRTVLDILVHPLRIAGIGPAAQDIVHLLFFGSSVECVGNKK